MRRHSCRVLALVAVLCLCLSAVPPVTGMDAASGSSARIATAGHQASPLPQGDAPGQTASVGAANVTEVTLITGQTVTVISRGGEQTYRVNADVRMQRVETPNGTYIYPAGTDFQTFDTDLFNVDLLVRQNLTDAESQSIPVIIAAAGSTKQYRTTRSADAFASTAGTTQDERLQSIGASAGTVSKAAAADVSRTWADDPAIKRVSLDVAYTLTLDEANALVSAPTARQQYNVSGNGVNVAIIDSGINNSHPALNGSVVLEKDFTGEGTVEDVAGHGTHVAGIVAADPSANGTHSGIAPNASLFNIRVIDSYGYGTTSDIINGMEYAVDNNADMLSLSLGGPPRGVRSNSPFQDAVAYAHTNGVPVVAAAGNAGPGYRTVGDPGVQRQAITVGASDKSGGIASFSSRGPTYGYSLKPDLVAPGAAINSTDPFSDGYVEYSGTSMATPIVSGTAALMLAKHPSWGPSRLKNALVSTADDLGPQNAYTQGAGQVNTTDAISPGVIIDSPVMDFGPYTRNATVSRTFTVTNYGETNRTLNVTATATDVISGRAGMATLNRSTVTLAPGENATVELTVTTGTKAGVYAGRISVDKGSYNAVFGYTRAYAVNVSKAPIRSTDVKDNFVIALPNATGTLRQLRGYGFRILNNSSDTTQYLVVNPGTYHFVSSGYAEDNRQQIVISETHSITSNTNLRLDESNTATRDVNVSDLVNQSGSLHLNAVQTYYEKPVQINGQTLPLGGTFLSADPGTPVVRTSTDADLNLTIERVYVPDAQYNASTPFESPTLYHLVHGTVGVSGSVTRAINYSALARKNVQYHRTAPNETYTAWLDARSATWNEYASYVSIGGAIGTQRQQDVFVSPGAGTQSISVTTLNWSLSESSGYVPNASEQIPAGVNQHPFHGMQQYWDYVVYDGDDYVEFQVSPQVGATYANRVYQDWTTDRVVLRRNGTHVFDDTTAWGTYYNASRITAGETVNLTTVGRNTELARSPRTVTTHRATYNTSADSEPPQLTAVNVLSLNASLVAPNGDTRVFVSGYDAGSNITTIDVLYANASVDSVPFDSSGVTATTAWTRAEVVDSGAGYELVSLNTTYEGNLSVAVRLVDEQGTTVESTTYNAVELTDTPPVPRASVENETVNVNRTTTFNGSLSSDNINVTDYAWTFGDGTSATSAVATHTYTARGTYNVTLTATDSSGQTNATTVPVDVIDTISPSTAVAANMSTAEVNITTVGFNASNTTDNDAVAYYLWDVDGDGAYEQNTTNATTEYAYPATGSYTPVVTAVDLSGNTANATAATITVEDTTPPAAVFTANRTTVNVSRAVAFNASASTDNDGIASYAWTFGDTSSATGETTTHTYQQLGNVTVTLNATDAATNANTTNTTIQVVDELPPTVALTANTTTAEVNVSTVGLDASSTTDNDAVAYYLWDFDTDGQTDANTTTAAVDHVYAQTGTVATTVTAVDNHGNANATSFDITVEDTIAPTVAGAANATTVNVSEAVQFDGSNSTDNDGIVSYEWAFDDATTATGAVVDHAFDDTGTYNVTLTVTDGASNTNATTLTVNVVDQVTPTAQATVTNTTAQYNVSTVGFNATASSDNDEIVAYRWDYDGDGTIDVNTTTATTTHVYTEFGTVTPTVTVVDNSSNLNTTTLSAITVEDAVAPDAVAAASPMLANISESVSFNASNSTDNYQIASYEWDFTNDSLTDATGATVTHGFIDSGTYDVVLTTTDANGTAATDTVTVEVWNTPPTADAGTNQTGNESTTVTLTATNSSDPDGDALDYSWTQVAGPDVTLTNATTATPEFTAPDLSQNQSLQFEVAVTDEHGKTSTDTVSVTVIVVLERPTVMFSSVPTEPTVEDTATFNASNATDPDGSIAAYEWDFDGDGSVDATGEIVAHSFSDNGAHNVTLTVTDDEGATNTTAQQVFVPNLPPIADAGSDTTVEESAQVALDGTGTSDPEGDQMAYNWTQVSGPSVSLADATTATPAFTAPDVDAETTLTFRLNVSDPNGTWDTDTVTVSVVESTGSIGGGGGGGDGGSTVDPTPTATPTTTPAGTPTSTPTVTDTPAVTETPTASPTTATTPTKRTTPTMADDANSSTAPPAENASPTAGDGPGFGIAVTVLALLAAGIGRFCRR